MGIHENIRKHECKQCGKTFSRVSNLKRHVQTVHQDIRIYMCKECNKSFGQMSTLNNHIQAFHGKTTSSADEVLQPNAEPDMKTKEGTADEQERMTNIDIDQTDN